MQTALVLLVSSMLSGIWANPLEPRAGGAPSGGQPLICPGLKTMDKGCIRYTRGFDVTGVVTEVDLTYPHIKTECQCIQACLEAPTTCANYVYKFSTPQSVQIGHRTCTLYSQFNLPSAVTIEIAINSSNNTDVQYLNPANNPQAGGLVPQAFKDASLSKTPDPDAVSGPVWTLSNGKVQC